MWIHQPIGSWVAIDEEFPQRVGQTVKATASILRIFFNSKAFIKVNWLP
jgi:hypothetical protein